MKREIPRHGFDPAFAAEQAASHAEDVEGALSRIERYPRAISTLVDDALRHAGYRCILDPLVERGETWEALTVAMQAASAAFAAGAQEDGVVECLIAGELRRIPATGPKHWHDAGAWLRAAWLAFVCREADRLNMLCSFPLEALRAQGGFDPYIYAWIEAIRRYWRNEEGAYDSLLEALRGTDPSVLPADSDAVLFLMYPPIKIFSYLYDRDADQFNEALAEALELHEQYWSGDRQRALSPFGFLALGPLALACFARDQGLPIEVESDYLPANLVNAVWYGEFST